MACSGYSVADEKVGNLSVLGHWCNRPLDALPQDRVKTSFRNRREITAIVVVDVEGSPYRPLRRV